LLSEGHLDAPGNLEWTISELARQMAQENRRICIHTHCRKLRECQTITVWVSL